VQAREITRRDAARRLLLRARMKCITALAVLLSASLFGCADDGKGEEDELPDDSGKADSQRKPTDHGAIGFGAAAQSAITDAEKFHAWEFELSGDADLEIVTSYAVLGQRRTDTVLYLYREGATGWGPYIARNDDYGTTTYSKIAKTYGAGKYRALVKGFAATTRGKFSLTVGCSGVGCAPPAPANECVFGSAYFELRDQPHLTIVGEMKITPANLPMIGEPARSRLVRAVQQSSHTDVMTAEEALGRVDQEEVNLVRILEPAARRVFVAFEYGAGDNSYGAIFDDETSAMVTNIHDGDLESCATKAQTCMLPEDWTALRNHPQFTRISTKVVTSVATLTQLEKAQALLAFQRSYDDVTDVADGLTRVDDDQVNFVAFEHQTGDQITVVEYGAGDTSVGAIFYTGTTNLAGAINDLFIESCTLFVE